LSTNDHLLFPFFIFPLDHQHYQTLISFSQARYRSRALCRELAVTKDGIAEKHRRV